MPLLPLIKEEPGRRLTEKGFNIVEGKRIVR